VTLSFASLPPLRIAFVKYIITFSFATGEMPPVADGSGSLNGMPQKPIKGVSLAYTFGDAKTAERHKTQVFEMGATR
jgi:hypothetical protein